MRAVFQVRFGLSDGGRAIVTQELQNDGPGNAFGFHVAWLDHRMPVGHVDPNRVALGPQVVATATARAASEFIDECIRADHYNLICVYRAGTDVVNGFPNGGNLGCTSIVSRPNGCNRDKAKHEYKP